VWGAVRPVRVLSVYKLLSHCGLSTTWPTIKSGTKVNTLHVLEACRRTGMLVLKPSSRVTTSPVSSSL